LANKLQVNERAFDAAAFAQHSDDLQLTDELRNPIAAAYERFTETPFPDRQMEEWRRTNIDSVPFARFARPGKEKLAKGIAREDVAGYVVADAEETRYYLAPDVAAQGVVFGPISLIMREQPDLVAWFLGKTPVARQFQKFHFWNSAFFSRGVFLFVPDNVQTPLPFAFTVAGQESGIAHFIRNLVAIGDNATVELDIRYETGSSANEAMLVASDEIIGGDNAQIEVTSIQDTPESVYFFATGSATAGRDAVLHWNQFALGSRLHKSHTTAEIVGKGADVRLNGAYFASGNQHMDMRTMQVHKQGHTVSDLLFKGAVRDKARTIYQGMIEVAPGAQQIDAYQTNRNLILNRGARADSIPGLEIKADDVRCSHGATIGHIEPEEIFYLMSRGIPREMARRIVINGFFEEVIARVANADLRDDLRELVEAKINL
jgi:Fe-S cluster assembly protein SufD